MMVKQTLCLTDELLIGSGGVRNVYHHPADADKCIKITFNKKRSRAVHREIKYLKKYQRQNKPFTHLPKFHGFCTTNLGRGAVFDLIRDFDGNVSRPLSEHVSENVPSPLSPHEIVTLLSDLRSHFLTHRIIISDPAPHNLMVQYTKPDEPRLVIIDGIGNPHFIKLADYSLSHAQRIIKKKWQYYIENNISLSKIFSLTGARKTRDFLN